MDTRVLGPARGPFGGSIFFAEGNPKQRSRPAKGVASLYLNLQKQAGAPLTWGLSGLRLEDGSQHKAPEYCSPGIVIGSVLVPEQHHTSQERLEEW